MKRQQTRAVLLPLLIPRQQLCGGFTVFRTRTFKRTIVLQRGINSDLVRCGLRMYGIRVTTSTTTTATESSLFGLSSVDDYFASFNGTSSKNNNSNDVTTSNNETFFNVESTMEGTMKIIDTVNIVTPLPSTKKSARSSSEIVAFNEARLCPKLFLTQRAIQSFCFLLAEFRDPHSGKWIEDFLGVPNLANFHGTGALNVTRYPTWDSVLLDMMRQKNEVMIVSAKRRGRGQGGWSKNNPHLQERWVEFSIDIRPASFVQRLLPVREQLAQEIHRDLDIVLMADKRIMESYFQRQKEERGRTAANSASTMMDPAFERISVNILNNFTEYHDSSVSSSPLRRGNFDLLYSLCTHVATHRLLRELKRSSSGGKNDISFLWLQRFYAERVSEYFDGDQSFGRADDFLEALLRTPPVWMEMLNGKKKTVGLTDPLGLAERIIALRSEIVQEWKDVMLGVREDHLQLNDILYRVLMGNAMENSSNEVNPGIMIVDDKLTLETVNSVDSTGSFE